MPLVLIGYYNPFFKGRAFRNHILLAASLIFYAWGEPVYIALMLMSILVNWRLALLIGRREKARLFTKLAVIFNVGALFVFKYLAPVTARLSLSGIHIGLLANFARFSLPIGISFYTFQALSYI